MRSLGCGRCAHYQSIGDTEGLMRETNRHLRNGAIWLSLSPLLLIVTIVLYVKT